MKFAHLADCHIGGWREPELKELSLEAFKKAIESCIKENVAFILISGDLFNSALPSIELIKETADALRKAKESDISVYIIPGSHDFSVSGKTMLDVLEKAGLIENVMKIKDGKLIFTVDKTNVKIAGLLGRRGGLEKLDYENINMKDLESEDGFKIFMFHTALTEFKPKELEKVETQSVNALPKNFQYYAGGHVHYIFDKKHEKGLLTYPGALFPNNFKELEEFKHGGFYIVDDKLSFRYVPIKLKDVTSIILDADDKTPAEVEKEIIERAKNIEDKILTLRVEGVLSSGKPNDIKFKEIFANLPAHVILKNTNKLIAKEFKESEVNAGSIEEIEEKVIEEHIKQLEFKDFGEELMHALISSLNIEKEEGEKNLDFENRLVSEVKKILKIEI